MGIRFVIPRLRQLVFPERVWLLAKRDDARNITIWPASSYALLTHMLTQKNNGVTTMVHFSYLPPFRAGMNTWTHMHANTQLAPMDHRRANPKDPCAPWRKIYAHRGPLSWIRWPGVFKASDKLSTARWQPTCQDPPLSIISIHKQIPRQPEHLQQREGKSKNEHLCLLTGHRECQLGVHLSDKAPAHFLFHKVCRWSVFPLFALLPTQAPTDKPSSPIHVWKKKSWDMSERTKYLVPVFL